MEVLLVSFCFAKRAFNFKKKRKNACDKDINKRKFDEDPSYFNSEFLFSFFLPPESKSKQKN